MVSFREQIGGIGKGKVIIFGIGNRMKADDGAGPLLLEMVSSRSSLMCIDGGIAPENHLEKIVKAAPDTVFIADSVSFNGRPGEIRLFRGEEIAEGGISTHALSISMACEYLKNRMGPINIAVIGIQPGTVSLGKKMSSAVRRAVEELAEEIIGEFDRKKVF